MRKPLENIRIFDQRRKKLRDELQGAALIVTANPEAIRNHDVHYPYRQDSNMYYLTGFEEPESILVFRPGCDPETVMFVRQRDREKETWNGFRFGPEGVEKEFGIDKTYPIGEFEKVATQLIKDVDRIYYRMNKYPQYDTRIASALESARLSHGRSGYGLLPVFDADEFLGEMRLVKSDQELENMKRACDISSDAHIAAMRATRPGVNERQIHGLMLQTMMYKGCHREGYGAIVATGNNATTLHYNFNDQACKAGELLLIDYGGEYNYFTADITRTFPVSGKFTPIQKEVYQGVLDVQKKLIDFVKPGIKFKELHDMGASLLVDVLLELGVFSGTKDYILSSNIFRKYYPHGIGHWLGMDVHDAGLYLIKGVPRPISENMCFTIEPGLYFPEDDMDLPKELRGIGVRIEDNIRVTSKGAENLTARTPKEIQDLEEIIGHG